MDVGQQDQVGVDLYAVLGSLRVRYRSSFLGQSRAALLFLIDCNIATQVADSPNMGLALLRTP